VRHFRFYKIEDIADPGALAAALAKAQELDAGFRHAGYLWLNDSDASVNFWEYAVVRERDGLQVESFLLQPGRPLCFGRSREKERGDGRGAKFMEIGWMVVEVAAGLFDESTFAEEGQHVGNRDGGRPGRGGRAYGPAGCAGLEHDWAKPPAWPSPFFEGRLREAFDELEHDHLLEGPRGRVILTKAMKRYENRRSSGETNGERLFNCIARFCKGTKARGWTKLSESERGAFEYSAGLLQQHTQWPRSPSRARRRARS
jgi:hypothetical protein